MKLYSIDIKWISAQGNGIITTYLYKGATLNAAKNKGLLAFKQYVTRRYGAGAEMRIEDCEILNIDTNLVESGLFTERTFKNTKDKIGDTLASFM